MQRFTFSKRIIPQAMIKQQTSTTNTTQDIYQSLLHAVNRGRQIPPVKLRPAPSNTHTPSHLNGLYVENLQYLSDPGSTTNQEWVPLRLVSSPSSSSPSPSPVAILLHSTGTSKDTLARQQADFAKRGYLAATIDCRYHGERSISPPTPYSYQHALVAAWRGETPEHPFLLDNIWDLSRLLDVLEVHVHTCTSNASVSIKADMKRVGVTGVSLGGMHAWLLAAADKRIAAAAPMIGVQNFKWALNNNAYQPRVDSISDVFKAAVVEDTLGMPTREIVAAVWEKLLPGLLEKYDSPMSLPIIAPRPFIAINGELDGRCPLPGVELAFEQARKEYREMGAEENLELFVEPRVGHQCTEVMWNKASEFLDKHLLIQV